MGSSQLNSGSKRAGPYEPATGASQMCRLPPWFLLGGLNCRSLVPTEFHEEKRTHNIHKKIQEVPAPGETLH